MTDEQLADSLRLGAGTGKYSPFSFPQPKWAWVWGNFCRELWIFCLLPGAVKRRPFSGLVFQVQNDPDMGKAAHVRLFDGCLRSREPVPVYGRRRQRRRKSPKSAG